MMNHRHLRSEIRLALCRTAERSTVRRIAGVAVSAVLMLGFLCAPPSLQAQTKVAYLDAAKLLKRMPEAKDAETRIGQLISSWTREANDMQGEIDRKQTDFDRRKLIMTDAERNSAQLDLDNLHKRIDEFRHAKFDENGGELFAQQQQLMKPAYDRLATAIRELAADLGFDYVIDRSSHDVVLLYTNSKYDLTIPVARKLGIENEILSTPLVPSNKPGAPGTPGAPPGAPQPGAQPGTQPGAASIPGQTTTTPNPGGNLFPNTQPPNQPGFNSGGGLNPNQVPPPAQKH